MRRFILALAMLGPVALSASAANADVIFDVAVNVANLAPEVQSVVVDCVICQTDCERVGAQGVVGESSARHDFPAGQAHNFNGRVTVVVKPRSGTSQGRATDYLCVLKVANSPNAAVVAGTGPEWALPQPGTQFVNKLKGRLQPR